MKASLEKVECVRNKKCSKLVPNHKYIYLFSTFIQKLSHESKSRKSHVWERKNSSKFSKFSHWEFFFSRILKFSHNIYWRGWCVVTGPKVKGILFLSMDLYLFFFYISLEFYDNWKKKISMSLWSCIKIWIFFCIFVRIL